MNGNLAVIQLISNNVWGGGERYARDLSQRLLADNIIVSAITRGVSAVDSPLDAISLPHATAPFKGFTDLRTPRIIADVAMQLPADKDIVIHAHDFKNAFLAIRARNILRHKGKDARIVVTRHLIKKAKHDWLHRYIYRNIDALIFISRTVKDEFLNGFPAFPEEKTHLIYNAIPRSDHQSQIPCIEDNVSDSESPAHITFMGRISPEKGVDLLLRALSEIKTDNWDAKICGTGDIIYVNELKNLAESLGISEKVEWPGFVTDITDIIRHTDIGVLPSVWREPFGLTILEFISEGIPVVATAAGGPTEILTSGTDSLLVKAEPEDFAKALRSLVRDPEMRRRLGKAAKSTSQRYNYENFYRLILQAYTPV